MSQTVERHREYQKAWRSAYREERQRGPDKLPPEKVKKLLDLRGKVRNAGEAARIIGCSRYTVHVVWDVERRVGLLLSSDVVKAFQEEARRRNWPLRTLMQRCLASIADDNEYGRLLGDE